MIEGSTKAIYQIHMRRVSVQISFVVQIIKMIIISRQKERRVFDPKQNEIIEKKYPCFAQSFFLTIFPLAVQNLM